ncbi:glutenin, low molecular weight subunit-like [Monomorium pharaonis]|uniref:glutenin, low molecular weight subunit n=1 Tax=Monomorium pharaonis TaxID=307658 RepID=UPI00063F7C00|nr:glutenin, low molecular weight subunit [Monomorium pharaonis]XP_036150413.1 glutenin, low molecular weight subunit-like [Monomorium pharaonis]
MRFLFLIFVVTPVLATGFHVRERRQAQQLAPNYRAYNQAPAAIKQILAAQQYRDPIVHLPPQPVPNLAPASPIEPQVLQQNQISQYRPNIQVGQAPQQPTYKQIPVRPAQYSPPPAAQQQYNPQYRSNYAPQQQPQPRPLSLPQQQQAVQPNYQYSRNLPPELQQLVQIQQNLPNAIPQGQRQG